MLVGERLRIDRTQISDVNRTTRYIMSGSSTGGEGLSDFAEPGDFAGLSTELDREGVRYSGDRRDGASSGRSDILS